MTPNWHLYLIRCRDGSLYTGITTDVARRFAKHLEGKGAGAKYLRGRAPLTLVYQTELGHRSLALSVESKLKKLPKARKEELLHNQKWIDQLVRLSSADSDIDQD